MMKSYFDAQMQSLQEDVKQFALKYPDHARHLNLDSLDDRDPNVERLLEGFAYLTGRIQQSIDHDSSILTETLLETIAPKSLLPTPSKAIAQCHFIESENEKLPKEITSKDLFLSDGVGTEVTNCRFFTDDTHKLYPLTVLNIEQIKKNHNRYELKIHLFIDEKSGDFSMPSLRLYLNGEIEQRLSWLYALLHDCAHIDLKYERKKYPITLRHTILDADNLSTSDPFGTELLKDFFCFRDKFFFVEVINNHPLTFEAGKHIELCFELFESIGQDFTFHSDPILLGCMPIINNFEQMAEPLVHNNQRCTLPLLLDTEKRKSICLQEILHIESNYAREKKLQYHPFSAYQEGKSNIIYYRLQRSRSESDLHHIFLSGSQADKEQCLTITTNASNGNYPRKYLPIGSIELSLNDQKTDIVGGNITRPTNYHPGITEQAYLWQLIGALSENYKTLSNRNHFLNVLHKHDLFNKNHNKIEAICEIQLEPKQIFRKGVLSSGLSFNIKIDDLTFLNKHEVYLFGSMLHIFLLHQVQVNHFLESIIEGVHESVKFRWISEHGVLAVC